MRSHCAQGREYVAQLAAVNWSMDFILKPRITTEAGCYRVYERSKK